MLRLPQVRRVAQASNSRVARPIVVVRASGVSQLKSMNDEQKEETEEERTTRILKETTRKIKDLGRQGKPRDALNALAAMAEQFRVQPDTQVATALIDACARNGKMDLAQSVFDELFIAGDAPSTSSSPVLRPDEFTFAVLLRGYLIYSNPPKWTTTSAVLTSMEKKYGIRPSTQTFNVLLEACAKTNDLERGTEILERMSESEVQPDDWTFEAVKQRKTLRSHMRKVFG